MSTAQNKQGFDIDVCVIGTGRVGLPLALLLAEEGFYVVGCDRDEYLRDRVAKGEMPFREPGFDELAAQKKVEIFEDCESACRAANLIITVGTPLLPHIETDLSQINAVLDQVIPNLRPGHNIILRSTICPGTTAYIRDRVKLKTGFTVGKDIFLSFCPERIAEGKAYEELRTLPTIIGAEDTSSYLRAKEVFEPLTGNCMRTDYNSAELIKLFTNIARYAYFAVSNSFAIIADQQGANIHEILRLANKDYPRPIVATPGFTAGTCLRKDFGMINELIPHTDMLLSAWKTNEFIPKFLVDGVMRRMAIFDKTVAVLGYTFKKDADDTRDSLVPKLIRYLERENPRTIRVCEPHLSEIPEQAELGSLDETIKDADIIILATNHSAFTMDKIAKHAPGKALLVDIWNHTGCGTVFSPVSEASTRAKIIYLNQQAAADTVAAPVQQTAG